MNTIDTDKKPELPWYLISVKKNVRYGTVPLKLKLYEPKGKTIGEVQKEVKDMSPANWAVLQYLHENPSEVPEEFKRYWCYFFGTELRDLDGNWGVPCGDWVGSEFNRHADWPGYGWGSSRRVVLLDDSSTGDIADLNLETLSSRVQKLENIIKHHNLGVTGNSVT